MNQQHYVSPLVAEANRARLERLHRIAQAAFRPPVAPAPPVEAPQTTKRHIYPSYNVQTKHYHQMWFFDLVTGAPPADDVTVQVGTIIQAVCNYYGIRRNEVMSGRKTATVVRYRHIAMYLSRKFTRLSLPQIGNAMGGFDHTTILHGIRKMEGLLKTDNRLALDIATIKAMLR